MPPGHKLNGVAQAVHDTLHRPVVLPTRLVMQNQMDSLYAARERKVVEAICRVTGRTDYETSTMQDLAKECEVEEVFYNRGKWTEYPDGSTLFKFDGKDMLLFGPVTEIQGRLIQQIEELYDKRSMRENHHTKNEE